MPKVSHKLKQESLRGSLVLTAMCSNSMPFRRSFQRMASSSGPQGLPRFYKNWSAKEDSSFRLLHHGITFDQGRSCRPRRGMGFATRGISTSAASESEEACHTGCQHSFDIFPTPESARDSSLPDMTGLAGRRTELCTRTDSSRISPGGTVWRDPAPPGLLPPPPRQTARSSR